MRGSDFNCCFPAPPSPPQHQVEHHGGKHPRVERQEDDEQALGARVYSSSKEQVKEVR